MGTLISDLRHIAFSLWIFIVWSNTRVFAIDWPRICFKEVDISSGAEQSDELYSAMGIAGESCMTMCITRKQCGMASYASDSKYCRLYTSGSSPQIPSSRLYQKISHSCVRPGEGTKGESCSKQQVAYIQSEGQLLPSARKQKIDGISLQHCQDLCRDNVDALGNDFYCESLEFYSSRSSCILNSISGQPFGTVPMRRNFNTDGSFYQKICLQTIKPPCRNPYALVKHSQKSLIGFTHKKAITNSTTKCLSLCIESRGKDGFPCNSVVYRYGPKECILNKENHRVAPEIFQDEDRGDLADYFENNCNGDWYWSNWSPCTGCSRLIRRGLSKRRSLCTARQTCIGQSTEQKRYCRSCSHKSPTERLEKQSSTLTSWSEWSACSATCGRGWEARGRRCRGHCEEEALSESRPCDSQSCARGVLEHWSPCSTSCGPGVIKKKITCSREVFNCTVPSTLSMRSCDLGPCPNTLVAVEVTDDAEWTEWSSWTHCSSGCGPGQKSRSRECTVEDGCHQGAGLQSKDCDASPCENLTLRPKAEWKKWGEWTRCSSTCGTSYRSRTRACSSGDDRDCPEGQTMQLELCEEPPCPSFVLRSPPGQTIGWTPWGKWSLCSATCGPGIHIRSRQCLNDYLCIGEASTDVQSCVMDVCGSGRQNSIRRQQSLFFWTEWGPWTTCECAQGEITGVRMRSRSCTEAFRCTGTAFDLQDCACPVIETNWGPWGEWGVCDTTIGVATRIRSCVSPNQLDCGTGQTTESRQCGSNPFGGWSRWGFWQPCTVTCGGGSQTRTRRCLGDISTCSPSQNPDIQMTVFNEEQQSQQCGLDSCNLQQEAFWRDWMPWSSCTKTCGGGERVRRRWCSSRLLCGPGVDTEIATCATNFCPGTLSPWQSWTQCSATCGAGVQTRNRGCRAEPCGNDRVESKECYSSNGPCIGNWGQWQNWTPCTATCGIGFRNRVRSCPLGSGLCGAGQSREDAQCNQRPWQSGSCSVTCGDGTISRTRQCSGGFGLCGPGQTTDQQRCSLGPCPQLTPWGQWSPCSASCGPGSRSRSRQCSLGFGLCGPGQIQEQDSCFVQDCPTCGQWELWQTCSVTCGSGTQSRRRFCPAGFPGQTVENQQCFLQICETVPQNCGQWQQWQPCSVTCGAGTRARIRNCPFGAVGEPFETGPCQERTCDDRNWGPWSAWGPCSVTCGRGERSRSRLCPFGIGNCGFDATTGTEPCALDICSALWLEWGPWTRCSATCGEGTTTRRRECSEGPGRCSFGQGTVVRACQDTICDIPIWEEWQSWSVCSATCGPGSRRRNRICSAGFAQCGNPNEGDQSEQCQIQTCPLISWAPWESWGSCSATCGSGLRTRYRVCPAGNGRCIPGDNSESGSCQDRECKFDWDPWQSWGQCSATCGVGERTRSRICPRGFGRCSSGVGSQSEQCFQQECKSNWDSWLQWGACSVTCGVGSRSRSRSCPAGFGRCSPGDNTQTEQCSDRECPVYWAPWNAWEICSATCGQGTRRRTRECPSGFGRCNPGQASELQPCQDRSCSMNWGPWEPWNVCSVTCDFGSRTRIRRCPSNNFDACGSGGSSDSEPCTEPACPISWGPWQAWNLCSVSCGTGDKTRSRVCPGGQGACGSGPISQTERCIRDRCVLPCGEWQPWGLCSVSVGTGTQNRFRSCPTGGQTSESKPCEVANNDPIWGAWQSWICTVTCGNGTQIRRRSCSQPGLCRGDSTETLICEAPPCIQSGWGSWGPWSSCSTSCGPGNRERKRACVTKYFACTGPYQELLPCQNPTCIGPSWNTWTEWTQCSKTCGGGSQTRERLCPQPGQCGEGSATQINFCNSNPCFPVPGKWEEWGPWAQCTRTCGGGQRWRRRSCSIRNSCESGYNSQSESTICNTDPCTGASLKKTGKQTFVKVVRKKG